MADIPRDDNVGDTDLVDTARLRLVARALTDADFERDPLPAALWAQVSMQAGAPSANTGANAAALAPTDRRRVWLGLAAAVVVGLGISAAVVGSRRDRADVVAQATLTNKDLDPIGVNSSGRADVVRRGSNYLLHLEVDKLPSEAGNYIEVWMIDRQVKGMISLGPYHGNGDYVIPNGIDPKSFPIVDVSIEPDDGVPTHSGKSIVRGDTA
jgi:Anti-sigma-K factor rskA